MRHVIVPLLLVLLAGGAYAIVIVPPTVYLVSISLLSLVFNMFVGLFFWIAVQGIATKKFFGKPFDSIAEFVLPSAGKLVFALMLTALVSFLLPVAGPGEAFAAALLVAAVFFAAMLLAKFREMRNSVRKKSVLLGIASFSIAVLALSFFAITLSIELTAVSSEKPGQQFGVGDFFRQAAQGAQAPLSDTGISQETAKAQTPQTGETVPWLWLVPSGPEPCVLAAGGKTFSFQPQRSCVEISGAEQRRVFCPIRISPETIGQAGTVQLAASGSCSGSMRVVVSESGFGVLEG